MTRGAVVLLLLLIFPLIGKTQNTDINLLRSINGPIHTGPDVTMRGVSNSVLPLMIVVPAGLAIYNRCTSGSWTEKREPYVIGITLVTSTAITYGLKYAVNRPRPFVTYSDIYQKDSRVGPYSFPSGHSASAFALATSLTLCYQKWYVAVPAFFWASAVVFSRMYLGVHYPTDVLVGAFIGSACAAGTYFINRHLAGR
jgi:membrane-associated phospholipid phosphatase